MTLALLMWQAILEFHMEAFFLSLDKKLDGATALLRMVAETTRDVARISEDVRNVEIYLNR